MMFTKANILGIAAAIFAFGVAKYGATILLKPQPKVYSRIEVLEAVKETPFIDVLQALEIHFPQEAESLIAELEGIMNSGLAQTEANALALQKGSAIRVKHSPLIFNASDQALKDILNDQIDIYKIFADKPMICNLFLIEGPAGIPAVERRKIGNMPNLGATTLLQFAAMAQGRDSPVERTPPSDHLYGFIGQAMIDSGIPEGYLDNFDNLDPKSPSLCATYISYFEHIRDAEFDGSDQLRAQTVMDILGS